MNEMVLLTKENNVWRAHLALPNNLWDKSNEYWGFDARASTRRFPEYCDKSAGVRRGLPSGFFPEADARSSFTKGRCGLL